MLPNDMSTFLEIEIGVMMIAVADAVAEACANELLAKPSTTAVAAITFVMFFILFVCLKVKIVCLVCSVYNHPCAKILSYW